MVYFHAYMKVKAGKIDEFRALLGQVTPIVAKHGWKLVGSFQSIAGSVDTVVDLWELPDANALFAGLNDPELQSLDHIDDVLIEWETRSLMNRLPIDGDVAELGEGPTPVAEP